MGQEQRVVIVGAGPVGATTALLLADLGIECRVIERRSSPQQHPAAHVISTRTMEIWRQIGVEADVLQQSAPLGSVMEIVYCTRLSGPDIGRVPIIDPNWADPDGDPLALLTALAALSPTRATHFSQNRLEPLLWERLAAHSLVTFDPSTSYIGHEQDGEQVSVHAAGPDGPRTHRVAFMLAADGAASHVRQSLGLAMDGPVLQHVVSVHFSADLDRYLADRPAPVIWTHSPKGPAGIIVHHPPDDLVLQFAYFPPVQRIEDFDEATVRARVVDAVGDPSIDVRIRSIQPWAMTAQVAAHYRAGRVFVAGDAAHRFPPTGGLGLNTGVADAHNLAWKLAWVLEGRAPAQLLDTYETERRPVAQANSEQSVANYVGMLEVMTAMGLSSRRAGRLRDLLDRPAVARLPRPLTRRLLEAGMAAGLRRLRRLESPSPAGDDLRARVSAAIARQGPHYRSWGQDLGVVYGAGAVVADGQPTEVADTQYYEPAARPGGRLPHLWTEGSRGHCSIHDLVAPDKLTLLVPERSAAAWSAVVEEVVPGALVTLQAAKPDGRAWSDLGLAPTTGLLVRPDRVIVDVLPGPEPHSDPYPGPGDRLSRAVAAVHDPIPEPVEAR